MASKIEIFRSTVPLFSQQNKSRSIKEKVLKINHTTPDTNQGMICEKRPTLINTNPESHQTHLHRDKIQKIVPLTSLPQV